MCDYLTLTSYLPFDGCLVGVVGEEVPEKRMQYDGMRKGSVFYGQALQNGYVHNMLTVSGAESDNQALAWIHSYEAKATRIDVQMTVFLHNPNMRAMYNRLAEKWRTTSFVTSEKGDTIYIGGWKSERFTRIYQKDNKRLLRLEMCWKGGYSEGARSRIRSAENGEYRDILSRWLRYEVIRLDDRELDLAFLPMLVSGEEKAIRIHNEESDRERWLRKIVAPALSKYANSHDASIDLLNHLAGIIGEAIDRKVKND
jgi:hypothetical protein